MNSWAKKLAPGVALAASAAPLFAMTVHGWTNAMLFLAAALSVALLAAGRLPAFEPDTKPLAMLVIVALAAPLATTVLSAVLRGDTYPAQFDGPLRPVLAIPVFLVAVRCRQDAGRWLRWTIPLALVIVSAHRAWFGQPARWPPIRVTTAFVDPLVFGYLSLAFALMALMAISLRRGERSSRPEIIASLVAIAIGLTLCIMSESRSGWLALPVVIAVWLHLNVPFARRFGGATLAPVALFAAVVIGAAAYALVPKVHDRIQQTVEDVTGYTLAGPAPVSPVGLRITFLRIASDMIASHPIAGVGDTAHAHPAPASDFPYATPDAVRIAFDSAFHNQIVSDAVRHGIAGGLAAALLLLVPLVVYVRGLRFGDAAARLNASLGIAYGACIFVSSFTTEVVDLKYTASLYALVTAALCAGSLASHEQD